MVTNMDMVVKVPVIRKQILVNCRPSKYLTPKSNRSELLENIIEDTF